MSKILEVETRLVVVAGVVVAGLVVGGLVVADFVVRSLPATALGRD